ncbi:peptidase S28 [Mycena floridula]|nr:peptidase S28 [Mycena floridula]
MNGVLLRRLTADDSRTLGRVELCLVFHQQFPMKAPWISLCLCLLAVADSTRWRMLGPQGVNLWKLEAARSQRQSTALTIQDTSSPSLQDQEQAGSFGDLPGYWHRQPVDHFDESNTRTFRQRYWVNTRHYKPGTGAPVIVLDGGETSGLDRIPFLDTGIVDILAKATGGIGVVLEHRYYGRSLVKNNLTTDSLRWLTNEQAAADSAKFMSTVKFKGIKEDMTAPNTPWIYYGGSYAGARAAHMKVLYPDLVWGAIASSGVTHASITNWEYMDIIRKGADPVCSNHLQNAIKTIDSLLDHAPTAKAIKALFDLADLESDQDFVSLLEGPLSSWQSKCWHPDFISTTFDDFCTALNKPPFAKQSIAALPFGDASRLVKIEDDLAVDFTILNYATYIKEHYVSQCPEDSTHEECFGTFDDTMYQNTGIDQEWRLWLFQVCTVWGYFTTSPPDLSYPRIISKRLDLGYESKICKQAFLPGEHFTVPSLPNVTAVNVLGDFDIAADRLAIIDGEVDPWRPDTPHSQYANDRNDTVTRPFKLIPGAVHHWDEWGLKNIEDEPAEIRKIHKEMIGFVTEWLKDWKPPKV